MRFQRRQKLHSEVGTGPLTDIMFFLLLFFLIVSTLTSPNVIKLLLPSASPSKAVSKQTITVSITPDLKYYVGDQEVPQADLTQVIENKIQGITEPTIVLRVDKTVPVENLVEILDIGIRLRIKIVLATNKKE
ncbi:MAG: biopolymer transporter ExbD [Bacteroidia bacterium]|nr:biopolymer transporter ExbD [Bacteroidia bacterium]